MSHVGVLRRREMGGVTPLENVTIYGSQMSWTNGYYISAYNGNPSRLNNFSYSNAMQVATGYVNLVISHCWTQGGAFYDANMNYLGGIRTSSDVRTPTTHAIPSGTKYVRVNVNNSYKSSFYIQLKVS